MVRMMVLVGVAAVLTGCSSDPWRDSFRAPSRETVEPLDAGATIEIRIVEMEQVRAAGDAARGYLDERKLAPEDITPDDDAAIRGLYFDAFRFRGERARFEFVGTSSFTAEAPAGRDDARLLGTARHRGADLVFIASEFVGRGTEYRQTPVWSFSSGSVRWRDRAGRSRYDTGSWTSTSWVPVPVEVNRYSNVALFYRRIADAHEPSPGATH